MAMNPHFYKAKSRIGLTNPPIRHSHLNTGVEDAPDQILDGLLQNFAEAKVDEYIFSAPEKISDNYWPTVAKELQALKNLINDNYTYGETQVVLGGDNTVTLSSLQAVIERIGEPSKIGYIQFDSHGEMHQLKTSLSKNFHGMYMRPFFDNFDVSEIDLLVPKKLKPSQALTIGDIVFDGESSEEESFYKDKQIRNINKSLFDSNPEQSLQEIKTFVQKYEHIHINFDIDVFHRSESEATGLPEDGKWFKPEIFQILEILKHSKSFSIDLVEINPQKPGGQKTVELAQEILLFLLKD